MRGLGFVFLAACSFDPSIAQNTETDAAVAADATMHVDVGATVDAPGPPGPPMGSDCDMIGPIGFGSGHHGCCGPWCGR
jgi:hypothetical protein